jgi:hypothetical protein
VKEALVRRVSQTVSNPPKVAAPFNQQNFLSRRRQLIRQRPSAWTSAEVLQGGGLRQASQLPVLVQRAASEGEAQGCEELSLLPERAS